MDHLSNPMKSAEEASNYLNYLLVVSVVAIVAYLLFHNKQKVIIILDWRHFPNWTLLVPLCRILLNFLLGIGLTH